MKKPTILIPGERARFDNYRLAVEAAGGIPLFFAGGPAPDCDGLLLCGGGDVEPWRYGQKNTSSSELEPHRDTVELTLLEHFAVTKKPVLGVCRGMQLMNVYFGGELIQDIPGHSCFGTRDRLHHTRISHSFLEQLYGKTAIVNSAHHQAVSRLGARLTAVQWSPDGRVEGICHEALPVWGVQWHPERMRGRHSVQGAADGDRVFRVFVSSCR